MYNDSSIRATQKKLQNRRINRKQKCEKQISDKQRRLKIQNSRKKNEKQQPRLNQRVQKQRRRREFKNPYQGETPL